MTSFGYFLSSEEFGPQELIGQARLAQDAGFTGLAVSDHYHPWVDAQGNSGFVWSVLGALSQVTDLPLTTLVTCPTIRIHPAIIAQAAATTSVLSDGRFRLGVGSGEALNEHVLGDRWPSFDVRADMLEEAVEVIRELFSGQTVTHRGVHYTVEDARLYNPPAGGLPVYVSAFGPKAARVAGRIGDGLVTMKPERSVIDEFRSSGGEGKPVIGGVKVCWDTDADRAVETVHRLWASELLPGELNQTLSSPAHFEQATQLVTKQMVAENVVCGDDPGAHLDALRAYVDAGFDEVYVAQIGPRQAEFFEFYRTRVLPELSATPVGSVRV